LIFAVLVSLAWLVAPRAEHERQILREASLLAGELLPAAARPASELRAALEHLGRRVDSDLAVHAADGKLLVSVGKPLPAPDPRWAGRGWRHWRGHRAITLRLPDERWLVMRHGVDPPPGRFLGGLGVVALLAAAIALGAYPLVRRMTRRLERLETQVEDFGKGELGARVEVEGADEVAKLARSFNRAAERIEALVKAQRSTLASASHELRSPLARMRVAVELLAEEGRPELRERVSRDIAELDDLIGELLLASRLDTKERPLDREEVDLLALVAEEGARSGANVTGTPMCIQADRRMLRRMLRNLLENARRYGGESPIDVSVVERQDASLCIAVEDRGPGVPESERERIFEPFYRPPGARESAEGGVGLGLALVRQIAERHGGSARCLAREGGGTRFEVELRGGC
jgi:signal transduction histidine kinase